MSANLISAMRTGAVAGVAARYLSDPGAQTAAIIGAGVISRACARAILISTPKIERLKIFDLDQARARELATELAAEFSVAIDPVTDLEAAVAQTDVVSIATAGAVSPTIESQWVKPGAVLLLTGNTSMAPSFYQDSRIVVDNWGMHEALYRDGLAHPDGLASIAWAMSADLLELFDSGQLDASAIENLSTCVLANGTSRGSDRATIFIPGGMPVEDVAWAQKTYLRAVERGLGQNLQLWDSPHWS